MGQGQSSSTKANKTSSPTATNPTNFEPIDVHEWQKDKEVKACTRCSSAFSTTRRKHHCRKCGVIICSACSDNWKSHRDARLCKGCVVEINASLYLEKKRESVETSKHQSVEPKKVDQDRNLDKKDTETEKNERKSDGSGKVEKSEDSKDVINSNPSPYDKRTSPPSPSPSPSPSASLSSLASPSGRETVSTVEEPKRTKKSTLEYISKDYSRTDASNSPQEKPNTKIDRNSHQDFISQPKPPDNEPESPMSEGESVRLQQQINKLEDELRVLSESMKRMKVMSDIIKDCKLKFQQIQQKEKSINDNAKIEGMEDIISSLMEQKKRCQELIAQNKKQIEQVDTTGTVRRRLLASVSDCDEGLALLSKDHEIAKTRSEDCQKELVSLQDNLKLAMAKKGGGGWTAKYSGEWTHQISLSLFTPHNEYSKHSLPHPPSLPFYDFLLRSLPPSHPSVHVTHCELVHNTEMLRRFDDAISNLEKRLASEIFRGDLSKEKFTKERETVLEKLYSSDRLAKHNCDKNIKIVGGFHGTNVKKAESIFRSGFANLATLDEGWFGKGIYFTTSAEYATQYCKTEESPCLVFCYIILANPFPVIWHDAKSMDELDFKGKSNYKNYGSHYVPVVHYGGSDYRPPHPEQHPKGELPLYDEVVVFQETHILPFALIHLKCS